jgi:hypothetical protein
MKFNVDIFVFQDMQGSLNWFQLIWEARQQCSHGRLVNNSQFLKQLGILLPMKKGYPVPQKHVKPPSASKMKENLARPIERTNVLKMRLVIRTTELERDKEKSATEKEKENAVHEAEYERDIKNKGSTKDPTVVNANKYMLNLMIKELGLLSLALLLCVFSEALLAAQMNALLPFQYLLHADSFGGEVLWICSVSAVCVCVWI